MRGKFIKLKNIEKREMDLIFEVIQGCDPTSSVKASFSVEVGFFDTILEIKEKINNQRGIPVANQTMVFNGVVLRDDTNIQSCHYRISQFSHIRLFIAPSNSHPSRRADKIILLLKFTSSVFPVQVRPTDTVAGIKSEIEAEKDIHFHRLRLFYEGRELGDEETVGGLGARRRPEIDVLIKGRQETVNEIAGRRMKVIVESKCGRKRLVVEVGPLDKVGDLRKLLEKVKFNPPPDGYFFIHNQHVMEEDNTFWWHHFTSGDTIYVFNGYITKG